MYTEFMRTASVLLSLAMFAMYHPSHGQTPGFSDACVGQHQCLQLVEAKPWCLGCSARCGRVNTECVQRCNRSRGDSRSKQRCAQSCHSINAECNRQCLREC